MDELELCMVYKDNVGWTCTKFNEGIQFTVILSHDRPTWRSVQCNDPMEYSRFLDPTAEGSQRLYERVIERARAKVQENEREVERVRAERCARYPDNDVCRGRR